MSVSGLCQVCESERAIDRCDRCGTLVCDEHFEAEFGVCVSCAAEGGLGRGGGEGSGQDSDHPDVNRYEF